MRISHFFIDRPIFASVIAIVFIILGGVAYSRLPVAQYPEIAPPVINVAGQYPGASAETVAETVVAPIEQQINGVEGMLYISSNSTADGRFSIAVTFDLGTNLDTAQVQVQNRVAIAQPRLPAQVQQVGVTVTKSSPDILMVVSLFSPDKSRDALFISNYANIQIKDVLTRVDGVGSITVFGSRDYAMQVWLDPNRLQSLNLTATDVTAALAAQNIQVASGVLNQPPVPNQLAFQTAVRTLGRLSDPDEFGNIVVKQTANAVVKLRDVARIELIAQDYSSNSYLDRNDSVALAVFQRPGSNALTTGDNIVKTMEEISKSFPTGIEYGLFYNPTQFIQQSVRAVVETIFEAVLLVVVVIILFLQTWRAAVIPLLAIPISLIGTFFVDEPVRLLAEQPVAVRPRARHRHRGRRRDRRGRERRAQHRGRAFARARPPYKTMDEVGTALISIALVLCAVFVPSTFITGISGQFYRQFALTIASATVISLIVSLTLSPAMCALLLKPHDPEHKDRWCEKPIHGFFRLFNRGFEGFASGYGWVTRKVVRHAIIMVLLYAGILAVGLTEFRRTPQGFIPQIDRGILILASALPPGASLQRTDELMRKAADIVLATPGVAHAVNVVGFSGATFTNAPNAGAMFIVLDPFEERAKDPSKSGPAIQRALNQKLAAIQDAFLIVVLPPPVSGIGNAGGFRMMVEDRGGLGAQALQQAVGAMMGRAERRPPA